MTRITYKTKDLPCLEKRLEQMWDKMNRFGYGSRAIAARWLMEAGHEKGDPTVQKNVNRVAKKVAHILKGYVRGIHPTMWSGGVWNSEEAERILNLLNDWINNDPDALVQLNHH